MELLGKLGFNVDQTADGYDENRKTNDFCANVDCMDVFSVNLNVRTNDSDFFIILAISHDRSLDFLTHEEALEEVCITLIVNQLGIQIDFTGSLIFTVLIKLLYDVFNVIILMKCFALIS